MQRYEVLMLSVPEITQDEAKMLEIKLSKAVEASKGSLVSFERWGKYRLAYPVKKNDYGVYFLARFESEQNDTLLPAVKHLFQVDFHTLVMRHVTARLDEVGSLGYQRPQSLEEAPPKEVGPFARGGRRPFSRGQNDRFGSRDRDAAPERGEGSSTDAVRETAVAQSSDEEDQA